MSEVQDLINSRRKLLALPESVKMGLASLNSIELVNVLLDVKIGDTPKKGIPEYKEDDSANTNEAIIAFLKSSRFKPLRVPAYKNGRDAYCYDTLTHAIVHVSRNEIVCYANCRADDLKWLGLGSVQYPTSDLVKIANVEDVRKTLFYLEAVGCEEITLNGLRFLVAREESPLNKYAFVTELEEFFSLNDPELLGTAFREFNAFKITLDAKCKGVRDALSQKIGHCVVRAKKGTDTQYAGSFMQLLGVSMFDAYLTVKDDNAQQLRVGLPEFYDYFTTVSPDEVAMDTLTILQPIFYADMVSVLGKGLESTDAMLGCCHNAPYNYSTAENAEGNEFREGTTVIRYYEHNDNVLVGLYCNDDNSHGKTREQYRGTLLDFPYLCSMFSDYSGLPTDNLFSLVQLLGGIKMEFSKLFDGYETPHLDAAIDFYTELHAHCTKPAAAITVAEELSYEPEDTGEDFRKLIESLADMKSFH